MKNQPAPRSVIGTPAIALNCQLRRDACLGADKCSRRAHLLLLSMCSCAPRCHPLSGDRLSRRVALVWQLWAAVQVEQSAAVACIRPSALSQKLPNRNASSRSLASDPEFMAAVRTVRDVALPRLATIGTMAWLFRRLRAPDQNLDAALVDLIQALHGPKPAASLTQTTFGIV